MRIDAPIFTGSFSLNGSTLQNLSAVSTTGSNTFVGNQNVQGYISASALTGSIDFTNLTNSPTLVSGSSQVIDILSSLNTATASFTPRITNLESKSASVDISISNINSVTASNLARLSNLETKSASVDISITNINSVTASNIARLTNLETKSASVDISITNINSVTASNIARLSNLETKSASVDISITNINSYTSSQDTKNTTLGSYTGSNDTKWTSIGNLTGSYATTGSNTFFGTQTYSGSVYIANDLIVQGSSSIQYISASSVSIGTNIVQLNTANPSVRFAGLTIIDSGSVGGSGSFLYDSLQDEFIFVHRGNGTNVTSSHFVTGPETYDSLGNETYLTCNIITKGTGKEHLVDSCIFDNGTTTCIKNNLVGTGTMSGTTIYGSTAVCSPVGKFTSCIDAGSGTFSSSVTQLGEQLLVSNAGSPNIQLRKSGVTDWGSMTYTGAILQLGTYAGGQTLNITTGGNVGIGITDDNPIGNGGTYRNLLVGNGAGYGVFQGISTATAIDSTIVAFSGGTTGASANKNGGSINLQLDATSTGRAIGRWVFYTNSATAFEERMRITSGGNVGIGINPTSTFFQVSGASTDNLAWFNNTQSNGYASARFYNNCNKAAVFGIGGSAVGAPYANNGYIYTDGGVDLAFAMGGTERMRITSAGIACFACQICAPRLILNRCNASTVLSVGNEDSTDDAGVRGLAISTDRLRFGVSPATSTYGTIATNGTNSGITFVTYDTAWTEKMRIACNGDLTIKGSNHCIYTNSSATISFDINSTRGRFYQALTVDGTVTKGGGSFKIDHPLESKKDTYNLYHSFVESPKADLIYRGKVTLTDGYATVNIDTAADMSEGTFEVLVKDVQCFTTNENGWNFVKGTISGNILTIESDNTSCNDEISWMVIGERNDKWFRESTMVDENGKTIVEKLKSETT